MKLTQAQIEVIKRKALGETDSQVAEALKISPVAVARRRERVLYSTHAHNTAHAVYLCTKAGII